jgi:hypothetical protein
MPLEKPFVSSAMLVLKKETKPAENEKQHEMTARNDTKEIENEIAELLVDPEKETVPEVLTTIEAMTMIQEDPSEIKDVVSAEESQQLEPLPRSYEIQAEEKPNELIETEGNVEPSDEIVTEVPSASPEEEVIVTVGAIDGSYHSDDISVPREELTHSPSSSDNESFVFIPPLPKTPPPHPRLSYSEAPFMLTTVPNGVVNKLGADEELSSLDAEVFEDFHEETPEDNNEEIGEDSTGSAEEENGTIETNGENGEKMGQNLDKKNIDKDPEEDELTGDAKVDNSEVSAQEDLEAQLEEAKRIENETLRKLTRQIVRSARFRKGAKLLQEQEEK